MKGLHKEGLRVAVIGAAALTALALASGQTAPTPTAETAAKTKRSSSAAWS